MLAKERHNYIMDELHKNQIVKVNDLVEHFGITIETARRDLNTLQNQGLLIRIYGGAVLPNSTARESLYSKRELSDTPQKEAIGKLAASLIKENETIFLGNGSTVMEIARNIKSIPGLTVITASLPIVNELIESDINLVMCGGTVDRKEQGTYGSFTISMLKNFFVDKVFLGAAGVTLEHGASNYNIIDAEFSRHALAQSTNTILVADNRKFGRNALSIFAPLDMFSTIITDNSLSQDTADAIERLGIDLLIAQPIPNDIV